MAYRRSRMRRYKRRYGRTRRNYGATPAAQLGTVARQMACIKYPHTGLTSTPKIPDGSQIFSIGTKIHQFNSYTLNDIENTVYVIMTPASHLCCSVLSSTEIVNYWDDSGPHYDIGTATEVAGTNPLQFRTECAQNALHKMRIVSQGLKIRLTNNDNNNQGTWSAMRTPTPDGAIWWDNLVSQKAGIPATSNAGWQLNTIAPARIGWEGILNSTYANSPTFASGTLQDIGKQYFMLNDMSEGAHEFNNIFQSIASVSDKQAYQSVNGVWPTTQAQENNVFPDMMLDKAYDSIVIKIQGVGNVTNFILDAVQNIEYTVGIASTLYKHQTECFNSSGAARSARMAARRSNLKANKM